MTATVLNPRKALNKSFLKVKPQREDIERFKENLIQLLDQINEKESEEFHKNIVSTFLNNTYYSGNHYINTKARNDLVIHNGKDAKTTVGVIIEAKKPANKSEMVQKDELNEKAFQELVLYYLRERISHGNFEVRHLLITNIFEWYIFDVDIFEKAFAQNKNLVKQFQDFEEKRLAGKNTDFFYKEIAEPAIKELMEGNSKAGKEIEYTYFDIRDYEKILRNKDKTDDNKLIALFKLLSPEHLLKLPFKNDSNSLDKAFYAELLHIIGLTEIKDGSKKLIDRKESGKRDAGSIIENAITQLYALDKISRLERPTAFGTTEKERYFNVGLELVITWINRILFLKLLEAQLITYHQGDKIYSFLNKEKIKNYDDLNTLFFQVLAREVGDRDDAIKKMFATVPYLNSSLFEPTDLEHACLFISQLQPDKELPILSGTVLKDSNGKKRIGKLNALEYLFAFLDAYDFSSEGSEEIQEENKTLISASVLGLIFEKINGYKDGSFFTPGFITMFMCQETIRRAVVHKFNDAKGWKCKSLNELYDKIEDKKEANEIINSLKICDPAVGSGHFLVSALNEIIAIKSDLKILMDRHGKTLRDYHVEVSNDELAITDENGILIEYNSKNKESQRVQEALFHEKQTIIENSLFGVDINTNSVKICRLRLWIELLKNAYYKADSNFTELETLPNIDINIKCGNSLISRYPLDVNLSQALKKSKITIKKYREAVQNYRHATNKEQKREMEQFIAEIKGDFRTEISNNDPKVKRLNSKRGERDNLLNQHQLFELSKAEQKEQKQKIDKLNKEIDKLSEEIENIKNNRIYEQAFEWRFEFPEILNNEGDFEGFDIVIGNPPYIYRKADLELAKTYFKSNYYNNSGNYDLYKYFIERGTKILKNHGLICFITNSSFIIQTSFKKTREFILKENLIVLLAPLGPNVFDEATVDTAILILAKGNLSHSEAQILAPTRPQEITNTTAYSIDTNRFRSNDELVFDYLLDSDAHVLVKRLLTTFPPIENGFEFGVGINTGYIKEELTASHKIDERYHPMVSGSGISRYGKIKTDGYIMYDREFVKSKGDRGRTLPEEIFFKKAKILIVRTRNLSLKQRIIATIDTSQSYNLNRLSNIIARDSYNLYGLLGILNSKLFNWLYSTRYYDYEIKPVYIRKSPLGDCNDPHLVETVKSIMLAKSKNSNDNTIKLEEEVDEIVYRLYGIKKEERKIIEQYTI